MKNQTLIFKTKYSKTGNTITLFIGRGTFQDAMRTFSEYPYTVPDTGEAEQYADIGLPGCLAYYTKDRANLTYDELQAVTAEMGRIAGVYWEMNGFDPEAFLTAYAESELPILYEMGSEAYLQYKSE